MPNKCKPYKEQWSHHQNSFENAGTSRMRDTNINRNELGQNATRDIVIEESSGDLGNVVTEYYVPPGENHPPYLGCRLPYPSQHEYERTNVHYNKQGREPLYRSPRHLYDHAVSIPYFRPRNMPNEETRSYRSGSPEYYNTQEFGFQIQHRENIFERQDDPVDDKPYQGEADRQNKTVNIHQYHPVDRCEVYAAYGHEDHALNRRKDQAINRREDQVKDKHQNEAVDRCRNQEGYANLSLDPYGSYSNSQQGEFTWPTRTAVANEIKGPHRPLYTGTERMQEVRTPQSVLAPYSDQSRYVTHVSNPLNNSVERNHELCQLGALLDQLGLTDKQVQQLQHVVYLLDKGESAQVKTALAELCDTAGNFQNIPLRQTVAFLLEQDQRRSGIKGTEKPQEALAVNPFESPRAQFRGTSVELIDKGNVACKEAQVKLTKASLYPSAISYNDYALDKGNSQADDYDKSLLCYSNPARQANDPIKVCGEKDGTTVKPWCRSISLDTRPLWNPELQVASGSGSLMNIPSVDEDDCHHKQTMHGTTTGSRWPTSGSHLKCYTSKLCSTDAESYRISQETSTKTVRSNTCDGKDSARNSTQDVDWNAEGSDAIVNDTVGLLRSTNPSPMEISFVYKQAASYKQIFQECFQKDSTYNGIMTSFSRLGRFTTPTSHPSALGVRTSSTLTDAVSTLGDIHPSHNFYAMLPQCIVLEQLFLTPNVHDLLTPKAQGYRVADATGSAVLCIRDTTPYNVEGKTRPRLFQVEFFHDMLYKGTVIQPSNAHLVWIESRMVLVVDSVECIRILGSLTIPFSREPDMSTFYPYPDEQESFQHS